MMYYLEATNIAETAAAKVAYEKGDYAAAIPPYRACIQKQQQQQQQQQQSLGLNIDAIYSSMEKLATCYSKMREYDKEGTFWFCQQRIFKI
jgi:hypothetical protein